MKRQIKNSLQVLSVIVSLGALVTAMGFGCGLGWQPTGLETISLGSLGSGNAGDNGDLVIVSGQKTVSVAYYDQALENMISMAGLDNPRNQILTAADQKIGSFSENGAATTVNSPMLHAFSTVGAEICDQLVDEDRARAAADRILFPGLISRANVGQITAADISEASKRLARTFWQRNPAADELSMIEAAALGAIADNSQGNARQGVDNIGVLICTALIASTSAYEM